jgi:hypothetical protein
MMNTSDEPEGEDGDKGEGRPEPRLYHDPNLHGRRPFLPGNPGNVRGRKSKKAVLAEQILDAGGAKVVKKVIKSALEGDGLCIKLVIERILPLRRGKPLVFTLPSVTRCADVIAALNAVAIAASDGTMSPEEASSFAMLIDAQRKSIETLTLEHRIAALEAHRSGGGDEQP